MFLKTRSWSLFNGCLICVHSHFSFPHTNIGFKSLTPTNKCWTMGTKFGRVVDDHILISNLVLHIRKNSSTPGCGLTNLFAHCYVGTSGPHLFPDFKCFASHSNSLTSRTNKYRPLFGIGLLGEPMQAPIGSLKFTSLGSCLNMMLLPPPTFWTRDLDQICWL